MSDINVALTIEQPTIALTVGGPQGATGPTGPTGPQGPIGLVDYTRAIAIAVAVG